MCTLSMCMTTYTNFLKLCVRTSLFYCTLKRWTGGWMTARHAPHLITKSTDILADTLHRHRPTYTCLKVCDWWCEQNGVHLTV